MATGTADTTPLPPPVQGSAPASFDRFIAAEIDKTRSQVKFVDFCGSLLLLAAGILGFLLVTALVDAWVFDLGFVGRLLALLVLVGGTSWFVVAKVLPLLLRQINPAYAARVIEQAQPSLKNSLINFLLLRTNRAGVHELVYQAIEQQAANDLSHVTADSTVDRSRLIKLGYVLAGIVMACALYKVLSPKDPFQTVARVLAPWSGAARPARVEIEEVRPGSSELFHGQTVNVSARVSGARSSDFVAIVYGTLDGQLSERLIPLDLSADGLHYEAVLTPGEGGIQQDLEYRVAVFDRRYTEPQLPDVYPIAQTERFRLTVLPAPTIIVQSVQYAYPAYTKRPLPPPTKQADIEALEGTKVTITASANLPIKSAYIEFDPLPKETAAVGADRDGVTTPKTEVVSMQADGQEARGTFVLELQPDRATPKHRSYQLRFITEDGHQNEQLIVHRISVTRDLPPEIEILTPQDDRIEVPQDGRQNIEIRALDPDFSLSKVSLRAVSGGADLLDKSLLAEGSAGRGQAVVSFEFKPSEWGLIAGDEVIYWAVAADNRAAPRTGTPEPNTERTRNYHLKISAPAAKPDPEKKPGEGDKEPQPGDEPQKNDTPAEAGARNNPPQPGEKSEEQKNDGENRPGENAEKKPGENAGQGDKGPDKSGENKNGAGSAQPGEKSGEKSGDKTGDDSGNKQADNPGEKSGGQSGDKSSTASKEPKPGESGGQKTGSQKPGSDPTKKPSQGNDQEAGGEDAADSGGKPGAGQKGTGQAGQKPAGQGQEAAEPGSQSTPGSDDSAGDPPGQQNRRPGGPGGQESQGGQPGEGSQAEKREGPLHDGEVIEKINEHIKQKQQQDTGSAPGEARPAQPGEAQESGATPGEKQPSAKQPSEKQPGAEQGGEKSAGPGQTGEKQPGEKQPGAGQAGEKQPGIEPGEKQPGEKQPGEKKPGEMEPGGAAGNDQNTQKKPGASNSGESGKPQGAAETKPEGGAAGSKPEQQPTGGEGQNGQSGAGQKSDSQGGSPASQGENKDREKKPGQGGGQEKSGDEAKSPSQSNKQSSSQGGEGGDKSGGGKQGGGQGANQAGNDSAGGNSPGDQGGGAAPQPGTGPTSNQGGKNGPASEKPTGVGGKEQGEGTNSQQAPGGQKPGPGEQGKTPGGDKPGGNKPPGEKVSSQGKPGDKSGNEAGQPDNSARPSGSGGKESGDGQPPENPGDSPGDPGGGGGGTFNNPRNGPNLPGELPPEEKANLEYARKATDLALEHLRNQKENPDAKLLDELGMTKEELARFIDKWQGLKSAAAKEDAKAKRDLDESLRSLGLRSSKNKVRSSGGKNDDSKGFLDQGPRSEPPPSYLEQFNAFKRGTARAEK